MRQLRGRRLGRVPDVHPRIARGTRKKLERIARAICEKETTEAEAAQFGLTLADLDDASVGIWPDNVAATNVFVAAITQWRTGYRGATGLDYNVLPTVFRLTGISRVEWPDTFECVRVMESEALCFMAEQREQLTHD